MPRPTQWSDLRLGIGVIAAVLAVVVTILYFGRLGRIPGETYRVYVRAVEARGIITGSEVWLGGQKIGAVRGIEFLPPAAGAGGQVVLETELTARHRDALRHDSNVEIRSGGSLIGAPVVYLDIGSPGARIVAEGDTLRAAPQTDIAAVGDRAGEAMDALPGIMADLSTLATLARSPDGTLGAAMHARGGEEMAAVRGRMAAIAGRVRSERGTAGLLIRRREALMERAALAMSRVDSIRGLLGSDAASLGRFRRDSTLALHIADIRNEVSLLRAVLADGQGTLGRMATDSAIVAGLAHLESELTALFADVKRRPFRYLNF